VFFVIDGSAAEFKAGFGRVEETIFAAMRKAMAAVGRPGR
jgi:hypothetical protein